MFAATFAVIILGVLFSLYGTVSRSVRVSTSINQRFQETTRVMDRLTRDIRTVSYDPEGKDPALVLVPASSAGAEVVLDLILVTGSLPPADEAGDSAAPRERVVTYRLARDPARSLSRLPDLYRIVDKEVELLLEGVEELDVQARYEDEWFPVWPAEEDESGPPESLRVVLKVTGEGPGRDRTVDVEVLVPAGSVLESRSERL